MYRKTDNIHLDIILMAELGHIDSTTQELILFSSGRNHGTLIELSNYTDALQLFQDQIAQGLIMDTNTEDTKELHITAENINHPDLCQVFERIEKLTCNYPLFSDDTYFMVKQSLLNEYWEDNAPDFISALEDACDMLLPEDVLDLDWPKQLFMSLVELIEYEAEIFSHTRVDLGDFNALFESFPIILIQTIKAL